MSENATDADEPTVKHVSRNGNPRNEDDHGGTQEVHVEHDGETYECEKGSSGLYEHPGEDAPEAVVAAVAEVNDGLEASEDETAAAPTTDGDGSA